MEDKTKKPFEMKNNTISLFTPKIKTNTKAPDLFGNLKLNGQEFKVALWKSKEEANKFSGKISNISTFTTAGSIYVTQSIVNMMPVLHAVIKQFSNNEPITTSVILSVKQGKNSTYFFGTIDSRTEEPPSPQVLDQYDYKEGEEEDVGF